MNRRILTGWLTAAVVLLSASAAVARQPAAKSSFMAYRDSLLKEHRDFRNHIFAQYADFMKGVWHEYEPLKPMVRDTQPKPRKAPSVSPVKENATAVTPRVTRPAIEPTVKPSGESSFCFYSLGVDVPEVSIPLAKSYDTTGVLADQWNLLEQAEVANTVLPALMDASEKAGLNDYLNYRLVSEYVKYAAPDAPLMGSMAVIQNLLVHWGYDARLGYAGNGAPLLLLPVRQRIYGKPSMPLDGKDFYIFLPDGINESALNGMTVRTYDVSPEVKRQKSLDMVLGELRFPENPHQFDLSYGRIRLKGEVNANLMPVLYRYPQLDIECYVKSEIQPKLRQSLVSQIQAQLAGMENGSDVEELLSFMQHAFQYSTDEDNHGFEKPYFIEENLFYDSNDCEDRAIFYAYMLWHALNRENQIVFFPGHEATTIRFDNPHDGTAYEYDGASWYISDPTYIGARTGKGMPSYAGQTPKIDYIYRR